MPCSHRIIQQELEVKKDNSAGSCSGSDYIVGVAGSGPVGHALHNHAQESWKKSPNSFSTSSWVWLALSAGSFPLPVRGRKEPGKIGGIQSVDFRRLR